jgi:exodeoxyribonuclease VII small subunit
MSKVGNSEATFEEALSALESIVRKLESGELPLEQALELFENGLGLARRCQEQLASVERRVEVLLKERGEIRVAPLDASQLNNSKPEANRSARPVDSDDDIPF